MAEETKKQTSEEKAETSKEIVEDIKDSGVPEKTAEKEEKLDEKETEKADSKEHSEERSESTGEKTEEKETKDSAKKTTKKSVKPVKKDKAVVRGYSLPLSTKKSADMCRFIKGKSVQKALEDVEQVAKLRKPVPFRGEHPHQKGIMSGGYPKKTAEHFVKLLKSLSANAEYVGIENPVVAEANANIAQRPFGKFGRVRKKRTHVTIIAKEKSKINKKKKSTKKTRKEE